MDDSGGAWRSGFVLAVRKKRSSVSRQPCSDFQKFSQGFICPPHPIQNLGSGGNGEGGFIQEAGVYPNGLSSENRPKKLKLKFGGVTRTIQAKYESESTQCFNAPQLQDKDYTFGKNQSLRGKLHGERVYANETYEQEPVRKSKRVPKRRVLELGLGEDNDDGVDEEIRYLGRLKSSKVFPNGTQREEEINGNVKNYELSNLSNKNVTRLKSEKFDDDKDYVEEEPISNDVTEYKNKKLRFVEGRSRTIGSPIEFPNGLPSPPSRKQKANLSEVEQQLKRAEALQRRRVQSEKAAKEAEAEAIRKILGQDSARKRKEEKMKKKRDELAQTKSANSSALGSNTIRWISGPIGSAVIFSDDIGLPKIFSSAPCSYPPPREKCAGPNCTNAYKYRDSKSNLPLCSLQCYKAIHDKTPTSVTCR